MIAWFARNPVAANLLLFAIAVGGFIALRSHVTLEVFPPSDPRVISISVSLRGATPEDIELGVAVRVEEALADLEGIEQIVSTSVEGATRISVEVDPDYDPRDMLDDVKTRVDAINTFPTEAERPVINLATRRFDVIDVVVAGEHSEAETRILAEQVRDDLLRLDGVTQVELSDARDYQISIEASADDLRRYGLSLAEVAGAIRESSLDLSAGNVRTDAGDVLIRSKGQAYRRTDFEDIVVRTNADGSIVTVRDVAVVNDGFEEDAIRTRFNGQSAVILGVSRVGKQNAIDIAAAVRNYIDDRQATLPKGFELTYWDDDSIVLKNRLGILGNSAIQGSLLVITLLALFLRPAIAIWVFVGIPISFLGAFLSMAVFDISLNLMSAFGFIIVLGIVVDDAIVTGENVYRHMREGSDSLTASIEGTKSVAIPVTFGVLTTIAAFTPLMYLEGRLGDIFAPIPAVVIPVLIFSLIESKFVLPAHLRNIKIAHEGDKQSRLQNWQRRFANGFEGMILRYYRPALDLALNHRYTMIALFVGSLILIFALIVSGWTRFVFMPRIASETARASLSMPIGTPFEVTDRHIQRILNAAQQLRDEYRDPVTGESVILDVLASTGSAGRSGSGSHLGRVQFEITPPETRQLDVSSTELVSKWRRMIGQVAGAESLTFRAEFFRSGDPIDVQLSGSSLETLSTLAEEIKQRLATYAGVFEIADSLSNGKEELRIELTQEGHVLGVSRNDVVSQVGQAFKGFEVQRVQRGRDDVRVLVRYPLSERRTLDSLNDLLVTTGDGRRVPLPAVATLTAGRGPAEIRRIDRYRTVNITADVDKENTNMTVLMADLTEYLDQLLAQYPGVTYTTEGEDRQRRESFGSLQLGLIIVLFVIYALLALPLRSYLQPLIVMSVIPFGIIGAVIGHWIMGYDLSILSLLGLMALIGVVVNDSLVLVDYINQRRAAGDPIGEAIRTAGVARFRPVILTSLTTFFGLLPLLSAKSTTAQFLIPMGISLGFGILFATAITLMLVPVNVMIAEDLNRAWKRLTGDTKARERLAGT